MKLQVKLLHRNQERWVGIGVLVPLRNPGIAAETTEPISGLRKGTSQIRPKKVHHTVASRMFL